MHRSSHRLNVNIRQRRPHFFFDDLQFTTGCGMNMVTLGNWPFAGEAGAP
jgi:hypothetical protein